MFRTRLRTFSEYELLSIRLSIITIIPGRRQPVPYAASVSIGDSVPSGRICSCSPGLVVHCPDPATSPDKKVVQAFQRALDAGAASRMPVREIVWGGDRVGSLQDPFGYLWSLATHVKNPTPQELQEGAEAAFTRMAEK